MTVSPGYCPLPNVRRRAAIVARLRCAPFLAALHPGEGGWSNGRSRPTFGPVAGLMRRYCWRRPLHGRRHPSRASGGDSLRARALAHGLRAGSVLTRWPPRSVLGAMRTGCSTRPRSRAVSDRRSPSTSASPRHSSTTPRAAFFLCPIPNGPPSTADVGDGSPIRGRTPSTPCPRGVTWRESARSWVRENGMPAGSPDAIRLAGPVRAGRTRADRRPRRPGPRVVGPPLTRRDRSGRLGRYQARAHSIVNDRTGRDRPRPCRPVRARAAAGRPAGPSFHLPQSCEDRGGVKRLFLADRSERSPQSVSRVVATIRCRRSAPPGGTTLQAYLRRKRVFFSNRRPENARPISALPPPPGCVGRRCVTRKSPSSGRKDAGVRGMRRLLFTRRGGPGAIPRTFGSLFHDQLRRWRTLEDRLAGLNRRIVAEQQAIRRAPGGMGHMNRPDRPGRTASCPYRAHADAGLNKIIEHGARDSGALPGVDSPVRRPPRR